ncbi:MAG: UbiA family prenyltransferase [Sphingobium sp.]
MNEGGADAPGGMAVGPAPLPLVVDLDGTLIRSDLLVETFFHAVGSDWRNSYRLVAPLLKGKAEFKAAIADAASIDAATLPFEDAVLAYIRQAVADGRPVWLASASHAQHVEAIADHLGLFAGWIASDGATNLAGAAKASRLVEMFGEKGFDYIGNSKADLPVWAVARRCISINTNGSVRRQVVSRFLEPEFLASKPGGWKRWIKLIRVHQYDKNALVFVPLLTSHSFDVSLILAALGAFFAFSFCASSVYVINDLVDLKADRAHPRKRFRPLAAGVISPFAAIGLAVLLLIAGFSIAAMVGPTFLLVLAAYFAMTCAYSFSLKRKMLVDAIMLAMLYSIRVIGGSAAVGIWMSEWLFAFSMFIFTALALVKRYTELSVLLHADLPDPSNRNYRVADLPIIATLVAASGFNAVTVFALYVSSDNVKQLYARPLLLWLICPILMYWIARVLMLAHRRMMDDDPISFALRDWRSCVCLGAIMAIMLAAM